MEKSKQIKEKEKIMKNIAFFKALLLEEIDEATFTNKYDDSPKLKGKQTTLPDEVQAKIVKEQGTTPKHKIIAQFMGPDFFLSKKPEREWDEKDYDLFDRIYKMATETGYVPKLNESGDHEVSMAHNSLKSIVSSASQLMNLLGSDEKDIPAWIQDHITNAENYINQAAKNYHDYGHEQEPEQDAMSLQSMMEDLLEAKKKPSAGLTKKQKSNIVKKAKAGKDMGKKGKGFEKIVKAAEKSGADNPQAVAGAAFWKGQAKKAK